MDYIKEKVLKLAEKVAEAQGAEVFDTEILGKGRLLVRVTIDKEGGITLDDCEKFSRALEALLDVENPIPGPYNLEVSSPGLDRPLRGIKDFEKNKGKLTRIVTKEEIEGRNFFVGRIVEVHDNFIRLLVNNHELDIPLEKISKARLEVEFSWQKNSAM